MMKKTWLIVFLACAMTFAERSIMDFRIPPSSALNIGISGGLYSSYPGYRSHYSPELYNGFNIALEGFSENDNKALYGNAALYLEPGFFRESTPDTTLNTFRNRTAIFQEFRVLSYFHATDFFSSAAGGGSIQHVYEHCANRYEHNIYGSFSADFGFGYGRLRDGTNLWKALEIERIMKEEDIITDDLSSDEILAIAQTINQMQKFELNHDRFEKYFYQEMEDKLQSMGINQIPAYAWFRIKQIVDYYIVPRRFGYRATIGPSANGGGSYRYARIDSTYSTSQSGNSAVFGRFSINSAYPITYRLEYDQEGYVAVNDKGLDVCVDLRIDYNISMRLILSQINRAEYTSPRLHWNKKHIYHSHELSFSYFLEDAYSLGSFMGFERDWDDDVGVYNNNLYAGIGFSCYVW